MQIAGWCSAPAGALSSCGRVPARRAELYVHRRLFVSLVAPRSGPVVGGTRIALMGSGFETCPSRTAALLERATVVARHVSTLSRRAAPCWVWAEPVEVSLNAPVPSSGVLCVPPCGGHLVPLPTRALPRRHRRHSVRR